MTFGSEDKYGNRSRPETPVESPRTFDLLALLVSAQEGDDGGDVMAILQHEAWVGADGLAGCCLAGPMGDAARESYLKDGAKLVWTFEAGSHFEAMTKFNEYFGREPYTTDQQWDREPYPEAWLKVQRQT